MRRTAFEIYLWVQGSDLESWSFARKPSLCTIKPEVDMWDQVKVVRKVLMLFLTVCSYLLDGRDNIKREKML
jgi:hypothetical protein